MMTVQTMLTGFSAIVPTLTLASQLSRIVILSLLLIVASIVLFFYSVERSTDALDHRDPTTYVLALIPYNFAVVFLLVGLCVAVFAYGEKYASQPVSCLEIIGLAVAIVIPIVASYHWFEDGRWLLSANNRSVCLATMEYGEKEI